MSIEIRNLSHVYMSGTPFEATALTGINLSISPGEFVGVIGHTGSGKSTLVQHMDGLLAPTTGTVAVFGADVNAKDAEARRARARIGMVFQYPEHQLFEETVERDVAFGPKNMGLSGAELDAAVQSAVECVGLDWEEVRARSPFELSGGQRRRVAIAGVVAMKPDFLILDEPTAGLDPRGRAELTGLVLALHAGGTGIVMVTHNMDEIARVASRIVVMDGARIVMDGTPAEVFSDAEKLGDMGLDVPEMTRLRLLLKARGIALPADLFDIDRASAALAALCEGGR